MITSAEEFVALRTSEDPIMYLRAANDSASEDVWIDVITKHPEMRKWVAQNKTVSIRILRLLVKDLDPLVRSMVARKRKLDQSIFLKLAMDPDDGVRLAVALNPKVPLSILEILAQDQWTDIAEIARGKLHLDAP